MERHTYKQEFLNISRSLEERIKEKTSFCRDYNVAYMDTDVHPVRLAKTSGFLPEEREWFQSF